MRRLFNIGDEHSSSNYYYHYCDECRADSERDCKCSNNEGAVKNSSEYDQKLSAYYAIVAVIDAIDPMITDLLEKAEKNSKDIEEIKSMLRRLRN